MLLVILYVPSFTSWPNFNVFVRVGLVYWVPSKIKLYNLNSNTLPVSVILKDGVGLPNGGLAGQRQPFTIQNNLSYLDSIDSYPVYLQTSSSSK